MQTMTVLAGDYSIVWRLRNKRHRLNGPAVVYADGYKAWYLKGMRHRTDGPASVDAKGYKSWYLNDVEYSKKDFCKVLKELQCKPQ